MEGLRLIVLPGVLRPPSDAAVVAEHEGELGEVARERLDHLRSLGVADGSLRERMVVVEGRAALASPLQASTA